MFFADTYAFDGSSPNYNRIRFFVMNAAGASGFEAAGPQLLNNTWYHIALVYDGAAFAMKVYVNGALTDTAAAPSSLNNVAAPFSMGKAAGLTNATMTGALDDVYWYSRALSASEISQLVALQPPANLVATAVTATSVGVSWVASPGAATYEVSRSADNTSYIVVGSTSTTSLTDSTVSANTAYLYKVRALNDSGSSGFSNADLATTVVFADDPIVAGITAIKSIHILQLRTAVNAVRVLAGLPAASFNDPVLGSAVVAKKVHIDEVRTALSAARSTLGLQAISLTDPTITAQSTTIKRAHIEELRSGVK